MDARGHDGACPFRAAIQRYRFVGGAIGEDGERVEAPDELTEALVLRGLHAMWGYKPEEAMNAPAWVIRMSEVLAFDDEVRQSRAS